MIFKLLPAFVLLLSLSACSNKPAITESTQEAIWSGRQQELSTISAWVIDGRLGVKTANDAWSATLKWEHNDAVSRLRIIAAFHGTYEIKQEGKQYSLITPEDGTLVTENPEQVMLENVGWSIPVSSLTSWVKGIPDQSLPISKQRLNDKSQLIELQQQNWLITFANYKSVKQYSLPGKITLSNENVRITLLNNNWKLAP